MIEVLLAYNSNVRKRRILIVDDEPILLRSVARYFELQGWDVVRCADGAQGHEAARDGSFDAIVADFDLPNLTGAELMQSLVALTPMPRLVITSGHAEILRSWRKTCTLPVALLPKPYAMEELLRIVGVPS